VIELPQKYLIFVGDVQLPTDAKTGFGLVDWRREACVGQWRLPSCRVDLGVPDMTPAQALAAGARTLIIGIAPTGGAIAPAWIDSIVAALDAGLNVASGMHTRLGSVPAIAAAAKRSGKQLFDVRHAADLAYTVAAGTRRTGKRLLTVGTDCAVGKKYTALVIARTLQQHGRKATFRATGQTGIMIAGRGIAIDAVVADFIAGAAEALSPANDADHWDIIEGQGSLFHPAYAGVSLGLLHGSQPDAIVVCHEAGRPEIEDYPGYALPSLQRCIDLNLELARLTNPNVRCVGVSINTARLSAQERTACLAQAEAEVRVPCIDPVATGAERIVANL
jgi:uncharacterized NAD-dependent epimerase/dehydratase family protein